MVCVYFYCLRVALLGMGCFVGSGVGFGLIRCYFV